MKRILYLIISCALSTLAQAQHTFQGTSLSEALMAIDQSSKHYNVSFVYDELEDFTVTKTIKPGCSVPDAVREVCGFYPVRVNVKGHDINVECLQKDRTKLMGRLVGPDRQPVAYANIVLYSPTDSVYIGGGVSNEAGDFVIPCSMPQAEVRISCVGFKTIKHEMPVSNVGTIRMQMENNYLSNVSVSGRMPVFRSESNRLQYIVGNDEFARGLNAQELLNRVPMVSMAGGRAMILGQGPACFMLNGRITEMGNEAIQQKLWTIRSEDIERIEVISNPSGRGMMEMGGSYINIVMRRDQTLGWRGDVSAEAGISDDWSGRGSGSVTYASEKFDITVDAHGGRTTQTMDEMTVYRNANDAECIFDTRTKQTDKERAANLTFRYLPIKQLELGGMLSWQKLWPEEVTKGSFSHFAQSLRSGTELSPHDHTTNKSLTDYYDWKLDSKGKLLSLTYNNYKKKEGVQTSCFYTSAPNHTDLHLNFQDCQVDYHIQSGRLDLSLPFHATDIEVGASYTDIKNPSFVYDESVGHTDFQERNKAAYVSVNYERNNFSFKAGLRYEHIGFYRTYTAITAPKIEAEDSKDYWLPSFSFSFKPKEGHLISLSWGTSTQRPNFYDLNPMHVYKTSFESSVGNPLLQPSQTSHLELNYHNHKGLYASAYYHHAENVVDWGKYLSWGTKMNIYSSPLNEGRTNKAGLYLRYHHQLTPSLQATAESEFYYNDYKTQSDHYNDYDIKTDDLLGNKRPPKMEESLCGCGLRLAFSADWYLNHQRTLLLNARYQHWFSEYQGATKTEGYGYFYFALRYSLLNDRLRLSLVANDPFHQFITDETTFNVWSSLLNTYVRNPETVQFCHSNHHAHYIGLTATYGFGGKKVRRIQHDIKDTERQRAEKQK